MQKKNRRAVGKEGNKVTTHSTKRGEAASSSKDAKARNGRMVGKFRNKYI